MVRVKEIESIGIYVETYVGYRRAIAVQNFLRISKRCFVNFFFFFGLLFRFVFCFCFLHEKRRHTSRRKKKREILFPFTISFSTSLFFCFFAPSLFRLLILVNFRTKTLRVKLNKFDIVESSAGGRARDNPKYSNVKYYPKGDIYL